MTINPDFIAPCGLYCGVCAVYLAHRDNNVKFKERLAGMYRGGVSGKGALPNSENLTAEDIRCQGCLSDDRFLHCRQCDSGLRPGKRLHRLPSMRGVPLCPY